jgi:peptide/nickel transport system substrate-binding protein
VFMRRTLHRGLFRTAALASVASLVAGCGILSAGGSEDKGPIVVGTTSAPSTLDPAAAWDSSWELFRNIYQTLLSYPYGATTPRPDAAEKCGFVSGSKNTVYRCTLRKGLTFSDGHPLDAHAVKHSVDRILAIDVNGGPAGLLGSLDRVQVRGDREVIFHLNQPDATFPFVLATPALSIVDPDAYPAKSLRKENGVVGSGPYLLKSYGESKAELVKYGDYKGYAAQRNEAVTIRYYKESAPMVADLREGRIDVAFRGLAAKDVVALEREQNSSELQLVDGAGTEINYLVFNPEDPWAGKPEVRRAIAQIVDRGAIAHKVYQGTVEPLYSMVPKGLTGHTTGFFDDYGDPSVAKARKILTGAGITERVPLTLWYTTDRYGSATKPQFEELKRQLEASGLFRITLKSRPWKTYVTGYQKGEYPVFGRGWFPDFPDADNFIAPFVGEQNALGTPYEVPEITEDLLPRSRRASDRGSVERELEEAQQILVEDARLIPLWQGRQYVAAHDDISGVQKALDPSTILLVGELYRKTSW